MSTMERVIDWCEINRLAVDANFATGKININGKKHKFNSASDALAWAENFSKNWGLKAP